MSHHTCCWWCCHPFEGTDLHLPYHHDDRTKKFKTMGHFCSWECMKAFNLDRNGINKAGIISTYITLLRKRVEGKANQTRPAPNRFTLKMFGGPFTIDEFRSNSTQIKTVLPDNVSKSQAGCGLWMPFKKHCTKLPTSFR